MACVNQKWPDTTPVGVDSYDADDLLTEPHNFHSNPGYMGTSTASSLAQSAPGGVYRTAGPRMGGTDDTGHRPMPVGGRSPRPTAGRSVLPAPGSTQSQSEGGPLVVQTGGVPGR